jgi:hypothetical protein
MHIMCVFFQLISSPTATHPPARKKQHLSRPALLQLRLSHNEVKRRNSMADLFPT